MPVLHITSSAARTPDSLLVTLAADVAAALRIEPAHVFAHRLDAHLVDGRGDDAVWTSVVVQGYEYAAALERSAVDVIKNAWPDRRVSVTLLRDFA